MREDTSLRSRGWSRRDRRVLAGAVALNVGVSTLFAWDVFVPALAGRLGVPDPSLAVVFSVGLGAFTAGVLGGGWLADRFSPRVITLAVAAGVSGGLVATAFAPSTGWLAVSFGGVVGVSTGTGYGTAVRAAGSVATRRGLALSLAVSAFAAGTVAIAPAAAALLAAVGRVATFVALAAMTVVVLVVATASFPGSTAHRPRRASWSAPLYSPATLRLWLVFGLGSAPGLAAFAHAGQLAAGPRFAALPVALLSVGNLSGRLVAGPCSERIGLSRALRLTAALLLASCTALGVAAGFVVSLIALTVLGVQYGALSALTPAATADTVPAERLGASNGLVFTGWGAGGLLAPVAAAGAAGMLGWGHAFLPFLVPATLSWLVLMTWRPRQGSPVSADARRQRHAAK